VTWVEQHRPAAACLACETLRRIHPEGWRGGTG
jgi:hypothetical protein